MTEDNKSLLVFNRDFFDDSQQPHILINEGVVATIEEMLWGLGYDLGFSISREKYLCLLKILKVKIEQLQKCLINYKIFGGKKSIVKEMMKIQSEIEFINAKIINLRQEHEMHTTIILSKDMGDPWTESFHYLN